MWCLRPPLRARPKNIILHMWDKKAAGVCAISLLFVSQRTMWLEVWQTLQWLLWLVMGMHALIDCLCTLCSLFPVRFPHPLFATLYASVFENVIHSENATLGRVMVYWASAMSLTRVLALCFRIPEMFCLVALMYFLEGLVAEYEGFSANTIHESTARTISMCSFSFSIAILLVLCIVPVAFLP